MPSLENSVTIISKCRVYPETKSTLVDLKLSVSDLPMLSCNYIQKGCLFTRSHLPTYALLSHLKRALSHTLSRFPPLAGRLVTDDQCRVYLSCNDAGADFVFGCAGSVHVRDVLGPVHVPEVVKEFFSFFKAVSYQGHRKPILAVQVTELADGVFIGCSVNHAVTDGTSFWNFFNIFAEVSRGVKKAVTRQPDFTRESVLISPAVLQIPEGGPTVTFNENEPLEERIFSFSRDAIQELKDIVNRKKCWDDNGEINAVELFGKQSNDKNRNKDNVELTDTIQALFGKNTVISTPNGGEIQKDSVENRHIPAEISSFQSLCALLWKSITRARNLPSSKTTTFRMAVNCRHRLRPSLDPLYFGNAIQSVPTIVAAGDVLSRDLRWCAERLNQSVAAHDDEAVRRLVADWEKNPRCFPLGNFDGASITMGSSPRFPMYENDFGWGRPLAVRSGRSNKFDGKISAFPGGKGREAWIWRWFWHRKRWQGSSLTMSS